MYVFFFKQKTAYEMRISDWSSDVCSSDLGRREHGDVTGQEIPGGRLHEHEDQNGENHEQERQEEQALGENSQHGKWIRVGLSGEIGRASSRERVSQYV